MTCISSSRLSCALQAVVLCLVACLSHQEVVASNLPNSRVGEAFLQKASRHVSEPGVVDGHFLESIAGAPGNVLAMFYSPTCPDCEWLMQHVWKTVAEKLEATSDITVMTISDPQFAAPKPFEHWNNPAIFWVPKGNKMDPIFFPQNRLQEYLGGLPSRPQEQQDKDFVQDILVFAGGAAGFRLAAAATPDEHEREVLDVESLAARGWATLQNKWAAARGAQPQPVVAQSYAPSSLVASASAVQPAFQQPNQMAPFQQPQQPNQDPNQMALAYAEQFVRSHPDEGYTVNGVYAYAIPYYQRR